MMFLASLLLLLSIISSMSNQHIVVDAKKQQQDTEISIKEVSILLPYTSSKSRLFYRLGASNGCFEWSTNNQDLIDLEPLYDTIQPCNNNDGQASLNSAIIATPWGNGEGEANRCSTAVKVSVRSGFAGRDSTLIYAEDRTTNRRLRCEVFVDRIASISIETTTRIMYKDASEILEVEAFDSQGNRFSTVLGIEFEWSVSASNIIQIVPFKDASRDTDPILISMEKEGLQSSQVLVQGIDTGRATVTARLLESAYSSIEQSSVIISVLEPLQLNPSHLLYVIPGTQIPYLLQTEKRNQVETIPMPNPQYVWDSTNKKVGIIEQSGLFLATDIGKTEVNVQHKNMTENRAHAIVHVVTPSYLTLKIDPIGLGPGPVVNWNLIETKNYTLTVELYDASGHKIYNSDISYDVNISKTYFEPIPAPSNARVASDTYHVRALKEGLTSVRASLVKIYDIKTGKLIPLLHPISVEQEITISPMITLFPPMLYFPYNAGAAVQSFPLKARGGSGEYLWHCNHTAIVEVDPTGLVKTATQPGNALISVVDKKNPHNHQTSKASVIPPNAIAFSPSPAEVEVGKSLMLSTVMKSDKLPAGHNFDACSIPNLHWAIEDPSVFELQEPSTEPEKQPRGFEGHIWMPRRPDHCSVKQALALKEGSTYVTVDHNGMKAQARIIAYRPLTLDPSDVLVTLGSTVLVNHQGGPEPWLTDPKSYFRTITAQKPDDVAINVVSPHSFTVTCLAHTEQKIVLKVGNRASTANPVPASPSASMSFRCVPPTSVQLSINEDEGMKESATKGGIPCTNAITFLNERKPGSGADDVPLYKVRNNREIPFVSGVYDEQGNKFSNYSTLQFAWNAKDEKLAKWTPGKADSLAMLTLMLLEGRTRLGTQVVGYNADVLSTAGVPSRNIPQLDSKQLQSSIDLDLISNVKLLPATKTMYLSDKNNLTLTALGGSGSFKFAANNSRLATLDPQMSQVLLTPVAPGYLRIDVNDVCLGGSGAEPSIIFISDAAQIDLTAQELIQVGGTTPMNITVFDANNTPFEDEQYRFFDLVPHIDNPSVLSIKQSPDDPRRFTLRGLDPGLATLTLTNTNPKTGQMVQSRTVQIQVFPPFKVSPQTLHLVPGGHFQLQWSGGAASRQDVTFKSSDTKVATVNRGVIGELVAEGTGEALVTAIAYITDPKTGRQQIIGEDRLTVYVKNMTGIRLHSTIDRLLVGDELKLRVVGNNGETPFTYGTVDFFFKWECLDSSVLQLTSVYNRANTTIEMEGSFGVRVIGKSIGTTAITAFAYSASDRSRHLFKTPPFQITVIEPVGIPTTSLLLPLNTASALAQSINTKGLEISPLDCDKYVNCQDIITLQDGLKLTSHDRIGTCYLSVTRDGHADTSSLVKVSTKPFSHLEIIPLNPNSTVVAIGDSLTFGLYLRDEIGELFTTYGNVAFETEFSTTGVIAAHFEQNTGAFNQGQPPWVITAKAMRAGVVTLRVYLKGMEHIDDYVKIFVGRFIEPDNIIIHVGSSVQFELDKQQLSERGYVVPATGDRVWAVGDSAVMTVDAVSGKAVANQPGRTTLRYLRNPSSQTNVQVAKVASIQLDIGSQVINDPSERYIYPIRFYTSESSEFTQLPSIQNHIECRCLIKESAFAEAKCEQSFAGSSQFQCVVTPRGMPTSIVDKITMVVHVADTRKTYHLEKSYDLPFESSFHVVGKSEIVLSPNNNVHYLNIQSSNNLFVESSDSSLFTVTHLPASQSPSGSGTLYRFMIEPARNAKPFNNVPIYISNAEGKSKQSIPVSYSLVEYSESSSVPYFTLFGIILAVLIALATFIISFKYNQKPVTSVLQSRSRADIPVSPFRTAAPPSFTSPGGSDSIYLSQSRTGRF
ncbi:hypothetical protein SAMD00019534_018890 [Acytostelium subglobosum LB1]|uniref:hypothetical protein n=1 Tax=Acytostelium subglobosum LB1 TaxID=1410327 RepID=UPI0006448D0C|nr:hypothetical protein SAMD00019534_018890 [Acytostelium subglobosum LB1]GAM18714.1 hypothetical protein SAMD00019534_018890 [Acytostelium subglobosum LB1]|eukprot:XP_012757934.1 hypothetical protein SAMD00019534_018890 [Acytostelium subglobosum LB1]